MIELGAFAVSIVVFSVGLLGVVFTRKNLISVLISIELMLLASNINFVVFASVHGVEGYVYSMFVLSVAAAETALGLAIVMAYYRNVRNIDVSVVNHFNE